MQFFTNPWFIIFNVLNLIALIFLATRFYRHKRDEPTLFDKLKNSSINPANQKKPSFLDNLAKHRIFPTLRSKKPMWVHDRNTKNQK